VLYRRGGRRARRQHGNRARFPRLGAADVLSSLGVRIDLSPNRSATA
jgi:anthranilate phosphoribosyltransferase